VGDYRPPAPLLDLAHLTSKGPFAMPDYYFELRYQQVAAMEAALDAFDDVAQEFSELTGRHYEAIEHYPIDHPGRVIVCLGSTAGTVKDVVDELNGRDEQVGLLEIRSFRPFPYDRLRAGLRSARSVAVLDRAVAPGARPPLFTDVATALAGMDVGLRSYVYGLGGRDLHPDQIERVFADGRRPADSPSTFLGLRGEPCPV
jgi:pyruvate ferredoxin oxidoreductase alpha subunit